MSRSKLLAVAICATTSAAQVAAKDVTIPNAGISFSILEGWKYDIREEPGRLGILLKPTQDEEYSAAARCRIDRHELPDRFRKYTQKELNSSYAKHPLDAAGFSTRLSNIAGTPISVLQNGKAMLGDALAYWAKSTASETLGASKMNYVAKTYLSQTPGFAWNIQCLGGAIDDFQMAETTYKKNEASFDAFFTSIRFPLQK